MLLAALVWFYAIAVLLVRVARLRPRSPGYRRAPGPVVAFVRFPAKPEWVRQEVIRLKALIPKAGCRAISAIFNRRFAAKRRMTVGKSFVAELVRQHRYEIDVVRRQIKNARPQTRAKEPRLGARPYWESHAGWKNANCARHPRAREPCRAVAGGARNEVELDIDREAGRGDSPLRQAPRRANRQRSRLRLPDVSLGPLAARHPASENRSRLPVAKRTGGALFR